MLNLRTLGGLALDGDGVPSVGSGQQRSRLALLAVLAAAGDSGISRDQLLALFWPDADTERARGALKQAIYVLRRDLGQDLVVGDDYLRLNSARITSDIGEFDAACRTGDYGKAVAWYQGPFLPGVHLGNGEFTRWRDEQDRGISIRYWRALERLAKDADEAGEFSKALDWRRTLAASDPLNATVTLSLMRALVRSGDRTTALRQAAVHTTLVRSELEVEPDAAVTRLAEEIRLEAAREVPVKLPVAAPSEEILVTAAKPRLPRAWTKHLIGGAGLTLATVVALLVAPLRSDPDLVRIEVAPGSVGTESALVQNLADQIQNRQPTLHVRHRWGRAPQYRVVASVRADGDSLYFTARVTDRSGTRLRSIDPVMVAANSARTGMRRLGDQAAIAIAAARSRLLVTWAPVAGIPETWDGFRALETALQNWRPPEPAESTGRFDLAASLDPSSGTPLVLRALSMTKSNLLPASDSVLSALAASSRRLGPWDRAMIGVIRAWNRGDLAEGHLASHRLLDLVPDSEWALVAAYAAIHVGRGRETLGLLPRVPADLEWPRFWVGVIRHQAQMLTGEFAVALAEAEERLGREPESRFWEQAAVKALAALGRAEDVEAICARSLVERLVDQPCRQAISELRGRGHPDAAARVARRFLAAFRAADTSAAILASVRASLAYDAGDWTDLAEPLKNLPSAEVDRDPELRLLRAMAAAARGDRATVQALLIRLDAPDGWARIEAAALLGDKDEAVDLLARKFRSGFSRSFSLNPFAGLDRLHGYPPYESLVRPVDDPEHRARFAIR